MNIEEQRAHYAAIKNRIAGRVPIMAKPKAIKPIQPFEEYELEKERRHIAMLANGMPKLAPDIKASVVCLLQAYSVFWTEVIGKGRARRISNCRRAITWLLHTRGWTFPRIAELINCDHTSCVHAIDRANSWARNLKKGLKKATREWSGEYTPVPQLRGNMTEDIEAILARHGTTWTHVIVKAYLPEVILARRYIVLYLSKKDWKPAKIGRLLNINGSNVTRTIQKYGSDK